MEIVRKLIILMIVICIASCSKEDSPSNNQTSNNSANEIDQERNSFPTISSQTFEVSEGIDDNFVIGVIKGQDEDNDLLIFSIASNSDALFEVTENGELSLVAGKHLDYEVSTEHSIVVRVSDGEDYRSASITITVINELDSMVEDPNSFITKWEIPNSNFELILGTNDQYEYNFVIDWGDGSPEEHITTQNPSHVYEDSGVYYVSIQGDFPGIQMLDVGHEIQNTLIGIQQWGNIVWRSFSHAFHFCQYLTEYDAIDVPNLENVQNMGSAFMGAVRFNADLSEWDVSNVTIMASTFSKARSFNGNIRNWDVSNVTSIHYIFSGAHSFNQDISSWDLRNVINMRGMFLEAHSFNQDISGWDVSNAVDMMQLFSNALSFNQDISIWNTTNITNMKDMFLDATSFNQNIGSWNIENIEDMTRMFDNSAMSAENFSETMIGWANNQNIPSNIPCGIEGMSLCSNNQEAIDAMVFKLNLELEWAFSPPPNMVDCTEN